MKNTWNFNNLLADAEGIYLRPTLDSGNLYGVEVRFNNRIYKTNEADFRAISARIFSRSRRSITVITGKKEFRSGLIYLMVDFWRSSPEVVESTLNFLVHDVLEALKKTTTTDPRD